MPDRNAIELQAITAMKYIANVIVFIIDPSQNSGFDLADQLNLLQEVKGLFPGSPIAIMFNKIDVATPEERQAAIDRLHELRRGIPGGVLGDDARQRGRTHLGNQGQDQGFLLE